MRATPDPLRLAPAALACAAALAAGGLLLAADWPAFRGPRGDGVSRETGLVRSLSTASAPQLWRVPLGAGYSGISVVGERLYTMYGDGDGEYVVALDAASGRRMWTTRVGPLWDDSQGNGPRSTPAVHGGMVYAVGGHGRLVALDAADGGRRWSHELVEEYAARIPRWGLAGSALVEGDLVLVEVGGRPDALLVAFDRSTGEERWRADRGKPGYATPLALTVAGRRMVVFFPAGGPTAVDPRDGTVLWRVPWETSYDVNAAMPVFVPPDQVFISSGYDVGAALLRIRVPERGEPSVVELWRSREMKNQFSSSVYHKGYLYGFDDRTLKSIHARSGKMLWRKRGLGHGSLAYADGRLWILGDRGDLVQAVATAEGYQETGRVQLFDGKAWTVPTIAGGTLYARDEHEIVALDVSQ